jgi:hypothetical protein
MKKISILLFLILYSLIQLAAQESTFKKQDRILNLGVGIGTTLYTGSNYKVGTPPLSASIEFGVKDGILNKGSIGLGGYLDFSSHKLDFTGWGWNYKNIVFGARGVFHYPLLYKIDSYTGILLGYNIANNKEYGSVSGNSYSVSSGVVGAWFVGARYYFSDKFAVMGELGYGITYLNLGIALKL